MRHRTRHVYQSLFDHLETHLGLLGWMEPGGFKTKLVRMQTYLPEENGKQVEGNLVAVTLGPEATEMEEELGDGLRSIDLVVFVDVYAESAPIAIALADDIKDIWRGRISGLTRYKPIYDYSQDPKALSIDTQCEMVDILREPGADLRRAWQVVKATAHLYASNDNA